MEQRLCARESPFLRATGKLEAAASSALVGGVAVRATKLDRED